VSATRGRRWRIFRRTLGIIAVLLTVWTWTGNRIARAFEDDAPSQSFGSPADGHLVNGKRLPDGGANFSAYSHIGTALGRNSVHGAVRDAVVDAYAALARSHPDLRFVYGETGWPRGGPFPPHHTHRNGMSVDFMVPLRDAHGAPTTLSTWPWKKFGYGNEFDRDGRQGDQSIDNAAIVAHLLALDTAARAHGLRIARVIYDPPLQAAVFAAPGGQELRRRVRFSPTAAWVRHDEHYHVDFVTEP
jgi:penicillin-insensitive murein endopeptidase